jgi:quercetin dioxygenase-like cupin family protein
VFGEYLVVRVRNAGGHTRLHQHDCDQLLIVTGGMGLIATATEEHRLPPGTVIFVPAGLPHWHGTVAGAGAETIYLTRTPYATTVLDPGAAPG